MPHIHHSHPEKEERATIAPDDTSNPRFSEEQRTDIARLVRIQQQLGLDNKPFCEGSTVHDSTWVKLKNFSYTGRVGHQLAALKSHVTQLLKRREIAISKASSRGGRYIEFTEFVALKEAVNIMLEAADVGSENKVTLYVGPYGAGKTAASAQLKGEGFKTWVIDCLPSFHRSYFAAVAEIARVLGMDDKFRSATIAEAEVLAALRQEKGVLVFNELEALHNDVWTLLRCIVNSTKCAIVLLLSAETHRKLQRCGSEAVAQLFRRTEAVIQVEPLSAARVIKLMEARSWKLGAPVSKEMMHVAGRIAFEANRFGAFDCVTRVLDLVAEEHGVSNTPPPPDLFMKKLDAYRAATPVPSGVEKRAA